MDTYEFSLALTAVSMKPQNIADLLYEVGCEEEKVTCVEVAMDNSDLDISICKGEYSHV